MSGIRGHLGLALSGLLASTAAAQPVAPAGSPAPEEKVHELSVFVVNSDDDTGYVATSSLAGSRLKTDLKDVAAPISVFTKELLEDIGATTVNGALEYGLNSVSEIDVTGNGYTGNNFQSRMRGIAGAGRSRNFMTTNINVDLYNTERLDFSRGPNSVLFGIGSPAGIINSSTKFARIGRDSRSVQLRFGSFDERRASLDINESLNDKLAIRANVLWQRSDNYREFEFQDKDGLAGALTWRPFRNTTLRVEGERYDVTENRARPWTPFDGYIGWENAGNPGNNTATSWGGQVTGTASPSSNGIVFMDSGLWADQFVWNSGTQNFKYSNGATPNIPGLNTPPNVLDFSRIPRDANIFGAGARSSSFAKVGGVYLEQQINQDLSFELGYATEYEKRPVISPMNFGSYRLRYDTNAFLPVFDSNGTQTGMQENPNFGEPVMITAGGLGNNSHAYSEQYRTELRLTGAYHLDLRKYLGRETTLGRLLGHHRIAALLSDNGSERTAKNSRYVNIDPTRPVDNYFDNANRILWGSYYDPFSSDANARGLQDPFPRLEQAGRIALANRAGVFVTPSLENSNWTWSRTETFTKMLASQSFFWNDRIVGLLGWRSDEQDIFDSSTVVEPGSNAIRGFVRNGKLRDISGNTYTRGIVLHVIPDRLSVYYNRANNFQDNGVTEVIGPVGNLTSIGNRSGEGKDFGVKVWMFDGKLNASLAWYETSDSNQNTSMDGNYFTYTEGMWQAIGQTVDVGGRDTRNLKSEGFEFELTANPTRQITLTFNAKDAETTVDNTYPWAIKYIADNRAAWTANPNLPVVQMGGIPAGATTGSVMQQLDELMAVLTSQEGKAPFADRERTANFFGRYSFSNNGPLKGFGFGLGLQYRGKSLIAYRTTTDGGAVYSPDYTMANGMISYNRKISEKMSLRLQLNVDNLFDLQDPQPVSGGEPTAAQLATYEALGALYQGVVYTVHLPVPRRYSITATLSF